ncbi:MAG: dihydroorotate dehydrogenase electron transfer subunit [archaeon]
MVPIKIIEQETPSIKTFYLDCSMNALPGQFAMIWIPGCDEKPFTLTAAGKECAVTVQRKGKFTEKIFALRQGDKIGIRGPYGNGFEIKGVKHACIVAGGCGAAPILLLAQELQKNKIKTTIINGAKTGKECLFGKKLAKTTNEFYITTDDGSLGEKGFATEALERLLAKEKFDCVFSCGPEGMMKKVFAACEKAGVECQLNLERFMRCAFGVCGACAMGKWLVCRDGPVFTGKQLRKIPQFGESAMLKSGKNVSLKEFADWRSE